MQIEKAERRDLKAQTESAVLVVIARTREKCAAACARAIPPLRDLRDLLFNFCCPFLLSRVELGLAESGTEPGTRFVVTSNSGNGTEMEYWLRPASVLICFRRLVVSGVRDRIALRREFTEMEHETPKGRKPEKDQRVKPGRGLWRRCSQCCNVLTGIPYAREKAAWLIPRLCRITLASANSTTVERPIQDSPLIWATTSFIPAMICLSKSESAPAFLLIVISRRPPVPGVSSPARGLRAMESLRPSSSAGDHSAGACLMKDSVTTATFSNVDCESGGATDYRTIVTGFSQDTTNGTAPRCRQIVSENPTSAQSVPTPRGEQPIGRRRPRARATAMGTPMEEGRHLETLTASRSTTTDRFPLIRIDERDVATEYGAASEAPPTERAWSRYAKPETTAPHLDSTRASLNH